MKLDPDDRMFVATLLLAGGVGIVVLARPWLGSLAATVTWLALALIALAIFADFVFDTGVARGIGRWLNRPFKGPGRWKRPRV